MKAEFTRCCFDPWNYLEFRPDGKVAPCCMQKSILWNDGQSIPELHAGPDFVKLRHSLYSGDLDVKCQQCPIREMIPIETFRQRFAEKIPYLSDISGAATRKEMIRIDFTERCNLRCTYCALSQPDYGGVDDGGVPEPGGREMPRSLLGDIIDNLCQYHDVVEIAVNGHGETTCFDGWEDYCWRLLNAGHRLTVISNFAKTFSAKEIDVLARFGSITISIDSADPDILRLVRRKVNFQTIVANMVQIKMQAIALGLPFPKFEILAGIYDKNALHLTQLAHFAIVENISGVTFWKLLKYPDVGVEGDIIPLNQLPQATLGTVLDEVDRARKTLIAHDIKIHFVGNFIEELRSQYVQYHQYIRLSIAKAVIDPQSQCLSIDVAVDASDSTEKSKLFVMLSPADEDSTFYFLNADSQWVLHRINDAASPVYCFFENKKQVIGIHTPPLPGKRIDSIHIGHGENLYEIINNVSYITFNLTHFENHSRIPPEPASL